MSPAELLAVLILAGAILLLIYYYINEPRQIDVVKSRVLGRREGEMTKKAYKIGDKIMSKVKEVPISTDTISKKIDAFLEEKSDELIKDWSLATKDDISKLEKRLNAVFRNIDELEHRFNEYREQTNRKFKSIEERIKRLEESVFKK